ncbi:BON domain-containing protein [Paraburkholderia sp. J76]|uniref:BON domain-containing protein n=1 Tax=Paraburkholderia sp. J76 TaxID=2805439 RepID=UPI002ABDC931|nr:BON domain-containing protein [Paraburkholderia sp. J76]
MIKQLRYGVLVSVLVSVLGAAVASMDAQAAGDTPASSTVTDAPRASDKAADRALRKEVIRTLSRTKGLNTTRITVRVKGGVVMLEGSVPDQSEVDIATRAASGTSGVTEVKNTLTIVGPAGSQ